MVIVIIFWWLSLSGEKEPPVAVVHVFEEKLNAFGRDIFGHIPTCVCIAIDEMALIHAKKLTQQRGSTWQEESPQSHLNETKGSIWEHVIPGKKATQSVEKSSRAAAYDRLAKLSNKVAQFAKAR